MGEIGSISLRPIQKDSPGWYVACTSLTTTCHIFVVKLGEGELNTSKSQGYVAYLMSYIAPSILYFQTEGSFAKLEIPITSKQPKLCFVRESGIHVLDDAVGTPKYYRGLLPEPTK